MKDKEHILIVDGPIDNVSYLHVVFPYPVPLIEKLGYDVGYETVIISGTLENAFQKIDTLIPTIPVTDAYLKRVSPQMVGIFYDLLAKVTAIFEKNNLFYWAQAGTLLGAIRHNGLIPWDDDLDLSIKADDIPHLLSLEKELNKVGLGISIGDEHFYKIYLLNGKELKNNDRLPHEPERILPWKFPFLDVFPMAYEEHTNRYTHLDDYWKQLEPNSYHYPCELRKELPRMKFGPLTLPCPHNSKDFLDRLYGSDWNDTCYIIRDHENRVLAKKIRVALVDRSEPAYILPGAEN